MTSSTALRTPVVSPWKRVRGLCAVLAVVGFLGTAVIAPFTSPDASAQEVETFERDTISQDLMVEYVPEEAPEVEVNALDIEIKPEPKPEPETKQEPETETEEEDSSGTGVPPLYTGGGAPAEWMAAAGIAKSDWGYVSYIAERESGWNPNAVNASSGASGLIQALPCSKVPGNCFDPVDNLRWADGYAKGRYGSWAEAYAFWTANHWW